MTRRLCLLAAAASLASCGGGAAQRRPAPRPVQPPVPVSQPAPKRPPPGTLPQTRRFPTSRSAAFHGRMAALWRGLTSGSAAQAIAAFFPRSAYVQVKAEAAPGADWSDRLVRGYALDLAAAHPLVAGGRLLRVDVPAQYGHWVPPGACFNRVGYWEVPNARVVYQGAGGTVRSLGIASMISWRGEWYVVHLGSVGAAGVVDDPRVGPGSSTPSATC